MLALGGSSPNDLEANADRRSLGSREVEPPRRRLCPILLASQSNTCESVESRGGLREFVREGHILAPNSKAQLTRTAILSAAEDHFARRGFVATRLEDVAAVVGLKRAALFYHFRDKQSLYDAVIANAFGELAAGLEEAFSGPSPVSVRIERAVEVWVDTIAKRPTIARLILRHAAEAEEHGKQGVFPGAEQLLLTAWSLFEQGRANGELHPVNDDPFHAASAVLGATIFYVSALGSLLPNAHFNPLAPEQVAAHRRDALRTVRMLLGIRPAGPKGRRPASSTSHGADDSGTVAGRDERAVKRQARPGADSGGNKAHGIPRRPRAGRTRS